MRPVRRFGYVLMGLRRYPPGTRWLFWLGRRLTKEGS